MGDVSSFTEGRPRPRGDEELSHLGSNRIRAIRALVPLKGGGRESFPMPGTTAKTKNNLKTPSLFLLFPSLHFGAPFSLLRVLLPDREEQEVCSRPGCGEDNAPWMGIGMIRVEAVDPVVGGRSSQRQAERDQGGEQG